MLFTQLEGFYVPVSIILSLWPGFHYYSTGDANIVINKNVQNGKDSLK